MVLEQGKTAIVLVPEIALTPQTVDRFRAVFGDEIAVLHSALSDGERYDEWLALREGRKRIAVGARSAIFAPLADLGAIVVDEEHESSYKQGETPRYHAREVAIVRARNEGAVVVLGSATPSLESWVNATSGEVHAAHAARARRRRRSCPTSTSIDRRERTRSACAGLPSATRPIGCGSSLSEELETALCRPAREDRSRASCCSIAAATRRSCSAATCGDVADLSELLDQPHLSSHARAARLPLLPARRAASARSCPRCRGA